MRAILSPFLLCGLALLCGLTAGCGRMAPGFIMTSDGQMLANTDENQRAHTADTIRGQLDQQLGGHWLSSVAIAELPEYESDERGQEDGWRWAKATVAVELVGDGAAPATGKVEEVRAAVFDFLRRRVDRPKTNLTVTVTERTDPARFAALRAPGARPAPAAAPAAIPAPAAPGQRSYTIQAGDTLADISTAFYGSPQHWRRIAEANPGLDAAHLQPGTVIAIPPAP
jgi:LysM repeat protein